MIIFSHLHILDFGPSAVVSKRCILRGEVKSSWAGMLDLAWA